MNMYLTILTNRFDRKKWMHKKKRIQWKKISKVMTNVISKWPLFCVDRDPQNHEMI